MARTRRSRAAVRLGAALLFAAAGALPAVAQQAPYQTRTLLPAAGAVSALGVPSYATTGSGYASTYGTPTALGVGNSQLYGQNNALGFSPGGLPGPVGGGMFGNGAAAQGQYTQQQAVRDALEGQAVQAAQVDAIRAARGETGLRPGQARETAEQKAERERVAAAATAAPSAPAAPASRLGEVLRASAPRALSGDTLAFEAGPVRLRGVSAPDAGAVCRSGATAWRCGEEVRARLERLAAHRGVSCMVVEDGAVPVAKCTSGTSDMSAIALSEGLGRATDPSLRSRQDEAVADGRGIWAPRR